MLVANELDGGLDTVLFYCGNNFSGNKVQCTAKKKKNGKVGSKTSAWVKAFIRIWLLFFFLNELLLNFTALKFLLQP